MIALAPRSMLVPGFVARLRYLVRLRRNHEDELNARGLALLDDMIVRSFRDCLTVGAVKEAREACETIRIPKLRRRRAA